MSPAWLTHRQFLEVTAVQGVVQVLGDVFPGGKPVVSLLLPGVVMVSPRGGGERPPDLSKRNVNKNSHDAKNIHFYCFLGGRRVSPRSVAATGLGRGQEKNNFPRTFLIQITN